MLRLVHLRVSGGLQGYDQRLPVRAERPARRDCEAALARLWDAEDHWRNGIREVSSINRCNWCNRFNSFDPVVVAVPRGVSWYDYGVPNAIDIAGHGPYSTRLGP